MNNQNDVNLIVYIADNQALTRIGVQAVLNAWFKGHLKFKEFDTKEALYAGIKENAPHITIVDYDLLDLNSVTELNSLKELSPSSGILILTENQNPEDVLNIVGSGFTNYITKWCTEAELIDSFNATVQSRKYFSAVILDIIINAQSRPRLMPEVGKLTAAEIEIIKLISQGLTAKEIAKTKHLSIHTVVTHRKNIFRKLSINSSSELMLYAMRKGLIENLEYYI